MILINRDIRCSVAWITSATSENKLPEPHHVEMKPVSQERGFNMRLWHPLVGKLRVKTLPGALEADLIAHWCQHPVYLDAKSKLPQPSPPCQLRVLIPSGFITQITFKNKSRSYRWFAAPIACMQKNPCIPLSSLNRFGSRPPQPGSVREYEWH